LVCRPSRQNFAAQSLTIVGLRRRPSTRTSAPSRT
jgi:hypothetical protein